MNTMTYKGYTARIEFDDRDNILVGRLLGIQDIVSFHADNVADLRTAFEEAVDDYLETCAKLGKKPEKPASGRLMLRVPPEVHSAALVAAQAAGTSLNQWAAKVLAQAAHAG
ncbi:type II toxin-antitoxin system HicB family antitoxin [Tepidimonas taiwanensis]|uniref:HicB family protein n=1 Tax=Tepidimonas taiwanensis TaxID=307486 RepID=A0A554X2A5_9BURK|nr:type II toxin-antitoxin system HicB family antitoxin [Tepidimonas taiwanensis]MCX7691960.1 type II toxin-antitoxin system HicB family antitoxin [Tepidimonas taiwanensis]MDM7462262.1 type II toxin-antitoxin system HicB family antitoxin [Tepidimonas taiwanensis]TSE29977.1 HicB family protein [Tepidimonas taiwanensis]UBQ04593.1 type II toxin-antitoxin system HicB family antitoxin [Tepidimonas taiwanensis]